MVRLAVVADAIVVEERRIILEHFVCEGVSSDMEEEGFVAERDAHEVFTERPDGTDELWEFIRAEDRQKSRDIALGNQFKDNQRFFEPLLVRSRIFVVLDHCRDERHCFLSSTRDKGEKCDKLAADIA